LAIAICRKAPFSISWRLACPFVEPGFRLHAFGPPLWDNQLHLPRLIKSGGAAAVGVEEVGAGGWHRRWGWRWGPAAVVGGAIVGSAIMGPGYYGGGYYRGGCGYGDGFGPCPWLCGRDYCDDDKRRIRSNGRVFFQTKTAAGTMSGGREFEWSSLEKLGWNSDT